MWLPWWLSGKEHACHRRRPKRGRFDPWVGEIPQRRAGQPTSEFLPGEPTDTGAWRATVHRVTKSQTRLKRLGTHTDTNNIGLPWWLSGKESCCQCRRPEFDPWGKTWQPTPVFQHGEFHGQNPACYSPWGRKKSDTT